MPSKKDLSGLIFGRLTVIQESPIRQDSRRVSWECACKCGNVIVITANNLSLGRTNSCGCLNKEIVRSMMTTHGKTGSVAYKSWLSIKARCYNPSASNYEKYGGQGITMQDSFRESFENFYKEIGDPPDEGSGWSVDRIDGSKGYVQGNIRWATKSQQSQNRKTPITNTSGVIGVGYEQDRSCWVASWTDKSGRRCKKRFSAKVLGDTVAFEAACNWRRDKIKELNAMGATYQQSD